MPTFNNELIAVARAYIGQGAIYHQGNGNNCYQAPSPRCHERGLGPTFDCSGFMIAALSQVMGRSIDAWPSSLRHVREMWQASQMGEVFVPSAVSEGSLLVTAREYDMDGALRTVPGHVGIVTYARADEVHFVHASAEAGLVEERPLRTLTTILGAITLKDF